MPMDPFVRGVIEQYIDRMFLEEEMQKARDLVAIMELPETSQEVMALGVFLGTVYSYANEHFLKMYNRYPDDSELEEYRLIMQNRAREFKSKFQLEPQIQEPMEPKEASEDESEGTGEEGQEEEKKFSFDSKADKEPVTTILGIPIRE
jgi:hypothetical protein